MLFLVLVLGELSFLSAFVPLDVAVYHWIEHQRACDLNRVLSSEWPLITLVSFVMLLLGYLCYHRRWAEALHGTAIVVVGATVAAMVVATAAVVEGAVVVICGMVGNTKATGTEAAIREASWPRRAPPGNGVVCMFT